MTFGRTLNEIYFPAFKAAVEEGSVWSVMVAYNKLNGFYAAENNFLLTQVLKKRWGFQGLVMSDWGVVHSTASTVQNGLDLEMPTGTFLNPNEIKKALDSKAISESQINEMVQRLLRTIIVAGLMNGKPADKGSIDTPEYLVHRARRASNRQSQRIDNLRLSFRLRQVSRQFGESDFHPRYRQIYSNCSNPSAALVPVCQIFARKCMLSKTTRLTVNMSFFLLFSSC